MITERGIPTGFDIGGQTVGFIDLHRDFAATPYGKTLQDNIRFAPYRPQEVSHKEWKNYLGADVNNLSHLQLSLGVTRQFLSFCERPQDGWTGPVSDEARFSDTEQKTLLLTSVVHDWGESVIGDIPYLEKTEKDEDREMIILRQLIHDQLSAFASEEEYSALADNVINVLSDKTSKLGRAFNAVERVGYVRTALRALEQSRTTTGELADNFENLGLRVAAYHTPELVDYSRLYPPVYSFLTRRKDVLAGVFAQAQEKGIQLTDNDPLALMRAKSVWENDFLARNTSTRETVLLDLS